MPPARTGLPVRVAEGTYTQTVYQHLQAARYDEALAVLKQALEDFPKARAALSLLGFCHYQQQDFLEAAKRYEELVRVCPAVQKYHLYHAQSLYKANQYDEALKALAAVEDEELVDQATKLRAAIHFELDDIPATKLQLEQCDPEDPDTVANQACVLFKQGKFEEAREKFQESMNASGYRPVVAYHIALCHYRKRLFSDARNVVADIIDRGVRQHPELSVGGATDGVEGRSVGNSQTLLESALAFNLKAAIAFEMKDVDGAVESMTLMPPRLEEELDPVTLHNTALMNMETDATTGFQKLNFLLGQTPCPRETFGNLLLLYCKYDFLDLAADVLADNQSALMSFLEGGPENKELYEFIDSLIISNNSPEAAFRKFEDQTMKHVDLLRRITKQVQDARISRDAEAMSQAMSDYDEALERYIPVLMAQAKIYWEKDNYAMVEKLFLQAAEFCSEHETWKLNMAHTFFMKETNFAEAIQYYEPVIREKEDRLLDISAMVLANICVSYIMTGQNEEAEELMRRVEKEEERAAFQDPDKSTYHLCIINLVIGTLYCAKGNYEFGVQRIVKSLEPYSKKISTDTWYYAKRCFLGLADSIARHQFVLKDTSMALIMDFLDAAEQHGQQIPVEVLPPMPPESTEQSGVVPAAPKPKHVSDEARLFKRMFVMLRDM